MVQIVGIAQRSGVYEGTPYDNINFQCSAPFEDGKGFGVQVKTYKVKRKTLTEIFGKELTDKELAAFIGQTAEFYFDEYQNLKFIQIQQQSK